MRWLYIFFGMIMMMLLGTVYTYSVFRLPLEAALDLSVTQSGLPYMVALATYALSMCLFGPHISRFGPRKVIGTGGLFVALSFIGASFSTNLFLLTLTYGVMGGLGVGLAYGVIINVVAKWFKDHKGLALGLVLLGFGLSPLVTAPVARFLVQQFGIMTAFLIMGLAFAGLVPFLVWPFKYPSKEFSDEKNVLMDEPGLPLRTIIREKAFKGLYLNLLIGTMIGLMLIGMTTHVGVNYFKMDPNSVSRWMALFALANGLGRPIFGYITDHFSVKYALKLAYSLMILAALVVVVFNPHPVAFIIGFTLFWLNLGGHLAIAPTSTLSLFGPKHYSQNYGVIFTAYGIGALVGVASSGGLMDVFKQYQIIFYYVMALSVIGLLITQKYFNGSNKGVQKDEILSKSNRGLGDQAS